MPRNKAKKEKGKLNLAESEREGRGQHVGSEQSLLRSHTMGVWLLCYLRAWSAEMIGAESQHSVGT